MGTWEFIAGYHVTYADRKASWNFTDELLSYQQELTAEEIGEILKKATAMLEEMPYQDAFAWAKEKLEQYPNCESLILQMAVLLDAERTIQETRIRNL